MRLRYIYLMAALLLPAFCFGQEQTIRGIVFKKGMLEKLAGVSITNLHTGVKSVSNLYGEFSAKINIGDTLLLEKDGFTPLKQPVTSYSTLYITMVSAVKLDEVTVRGQTEKQELNDIVKDYRSKGLYYDGKPPITLFLPFGGSPITGFYELFSRDAKNERNFIQFAKDESQESEVRKRYTPELVSRITGLQGTEVQKFMNNYSPSYREISKWNDYELIEFIKRSYAGYKKLGDKNSAEQVFGKGPS